MCSASRVAPPAADSHTVRRSPSRARSCPLMPRLPRSVVVPHADGDVQLDGTRHRPGALDQQVGEQRRGGVDLGVAQLPQPVDLVHQVGQCGRRPTRWVRRARPARGGVRRPRGRRGPAPAPRGARGRARARPSPTGASVLAHGRSPRASGPARTENSSSGCSNPSGSGKATTSKDSSSASSSSVTYPKPRRLSSAATDARSSSLSETRPRTAPPGVATAAGPEQQEPVGGGFDRYAAQTLAHLHAGLRAHRTVGPRQGDHGRRLLGVGMGVGV